jgi:putative ABC transport system permease protein
MRNWREEIVTRLADASLASRTEMIDEIAEHLEQRYRALLARGDGEETAYRQALEELDDPTFVRNLQRTVVPMHPEPIPSGRRGNFSSSVRQDLRYAFRVFVKNPGFTAVALIALTLGIGANTAIFSVVNAVVLKPLPFGDPDRLVRIWESYPEGGWPTFSASHPNFLDWRTQNTMFEELAAAANVGFSLTTAEEAEIVRGYAVTWNFLPALGIAPVLGRNFLPEEDRPAPNARVAVLSYGFWQRRFGGDPNILQKTITLNGSPCAVIGILPASASFTWDGPTTTDLLVPLGPDPSRARGDHRLRVVGKLKPGVSIEQARSELTSIAARLATQYPASNRGWTVRLASFYDWLVPTETRQSLLIFMAAVGLVLLIACGNVASLLLARATDRQREISIRAALGADRSRIVRQLLIEALLLATMGGLLSLGIAQAARRLLLAYAPNALPRLDQLSIDGRVLGFALVSSLLTGLLFGTIPAVQASRPNLTDTLKEGTAAAGVGARRQRLRNALVVGEVALSVALLIGAGLLVRSFWRLQHIHPGFESSHVLTMRVNLPGLSYRTGDNRWAFYERLLTAVRALPGVQAAATSSIVPLGGGNTSTEVRRVALNTDGAKLTGADWRLVSPGYFRALGIPLRGRDFNDGDRADGRPVTIISESAARLYFPGEDALGKTIILVSFSADPMTVIGVAGDVRSASVDADPGPTVYASARAYSGWNPMFLAVRSSGDPDSQAGPVRAAVRAIDPNVPLYDVHSADELIAASLGSRRFNMYLLGCFAAMALLLACVGLFGVMAYVVSQRTHDIGLRLALGAAPRSVLAMILRQGLTLTVAGVSIGLAGGFAATRWMGTLLYSVEPTDPVTFVSVPFVLVLVSVLACYLPARRAMRVDPLTALRSE